MNPLYSNYTYSAIILACTNVVWVVRAAPDPNILDVVVLDVVVTINEEYIKCYNICYINEE